MKNALGISLACLFLGQSPMAYSDTPINTPASGWFCTNSHRFCAQSRQNRPTTTVYALHGRFRKIVWSMPTFVPVGFISDDGKVVVSCYPGLNLIPADSDLNFIVVKVFQMGHDPLLVRLRDIYSDIDQVPLTVSHRAWGHCLGFRKRNFEIKRADESIWELKLHRKSSPAHRPD